VYPRIADIIPTINVISAKFRRKSDGLSPSQKALWNASTKVFRVGNQKKFALFGDTHLRVLVSILFTVASKMDPLLPSLLIYFSFSLLLMPAQKMQP